MKTFRTTFTVVAFVLATGIAFAFTPSYARTNVIVVNGQDINCPVGFVNGYCQSNNTGEVCTFIVIFTRYIAIEEGDRPCVEAAPLRYPAF